MLQRDRLLHFDATTAKRTRVIDDELDYFVSEGTGAAAVWLDPQTRARVARRVEELREQRRLLRSQSAFGLSIDFNNMTVTEQVTHPISAPGRYMRERTGGSIFPFQQNTRGVWIKMDLWNLLKHDEFQGVKMYLLQWIRLQH